MHLCVNKLSGLALLRHVRITGEYAHARPCGPIEPDPYPQRRWSTRVVPHQLLGLSEPPSTQRPVYVVAPSRDSRPLASFFRSTVYQAELPSGSFLRLGETLSIPCPELLFVELATLMNPAALELVGYELCGRFCRDPLDPRSGPVTHGLAPVTSVEAIRAFIGRTHKMKGVRTAMRALSRVEDGAWSAMEAVMALMLRRPPSECGYGVRSVLLNVRQESPRRLVRRGCRAARVPDIILGDCPVGFNYDGNDHLDLKSVANALGSESQVGAALAGIRRRYVDDRRRGRELAAQGLVVMPVVSEDLFDPGGLDTVVIEALMASERLGGPAADEVVPAEAWAPEATRGRQRLLWSLLPWESGKSLGAY